MSLNNSNNSNNSKNSNNPNETTEIEKQTIQNFYHKIKIGIVPSALLKVNETYVVWNGTYKEKNSFYDDQIMTIGLISGEWVVHHDTDGKESDRFQGKLMVLHDTQGHTNQVLEYDSGFARNRIWIKTKSGCTKLYMFKNITGLGFV